MTPGQAPAAPPAAVPGGRGDTGGPAVLQAHGLSFSYPRRHVFTHWSAELGPGLTWLQGPNGCGKSTLLKLLGGALAPLTGTLAVRGIDAAADPLGYRREVFWCGPGPIAFDHLLPLEYAGFLQRLYPRLDAAALAGWLQAFGLQPFLHTRIAALSTGSQRKLALAAALACGTAVVLLDEPFNALDAASHEALQRGLLRAHQEAAAAPGARAWLVASHVEPLPGQALARWVLATSP